MTGKKCGKPTQDGSPCQNIVKAGSSGCHLKHAATIGPMPAVPNMPPPGMQAAQADPFADDDIFAKLTGDLDGLGGNMTSLADTTAAELTAAVDQFGSFHAGSIDSPVMVAALARKAVTNAFHVLAGQPGLDVDEQIGRLHHAGMLLLSAAAITDAGAKRYSDTPVEAPGDEPDLNDAIGTLKVHGGAIGTDKSVIPNVRTARARARKLAGTVTDLGGPDQPPTGDPAVMAKVRDNLIEAARMAAGGAGLIAHRDNEAHQAVKLGAGGLALPAIGSDTILETPDEAKANLVEFVTQGAADDADDWLEGLGG